MTALSSSAISRRVQPVLKWLLGLAACLAVSILFGFLVAEGYAAVPALLLLMPLAVFLLLRARGVVIALLVLAAVDALPGFGTSGYVVSHATGEDVAVSGLIVALLMWRLIDGRHPLTRGQRALVRCGALLVGWWLVTWARSQLELDVSAFAAAQFGRQYLFFGLLLMVLPSVRMDRSTLRAFAVTFVAGSSLSVLGQILVSVGAAHVSWLVHSHLLVQSNGLVRVYDDAAQLVFPCLALALGGLLLGRGRARRWAAAFVLLFGTSLVLQQTRASFFGLLAAFVVVATVGLLRYDQATASLRPRLLAIAAGAGLVVGATFLLAPSALPHSALVSRFGQGLSELNQGSGTIAVRTQVGSLVTYYLGSRWPIGLGFVPASAHYFPGLPDGSITDPDLGALNAIAVIGAIGAILIYLPLLMAGFSCLRIGTRHSIKWTWSGFGGSIWILQTIISSVTLVTLFSTGGLALTGCLLGLLLASNNDAPEEMPVLAAEHLLTERGSRRVRHPVYVPEFRAA